MKYIFIFLLALVCGTANAKEGVVYDVEILRVIDGDTISFKADWLPDPLKKRLYLRVYGVDTPEKGARARCDYEAELGKEASNFTRQLIKSSEQRQIVLMGHDKYGGRVIGDLILDGKSLREQLINNKYAKPYFGGTKESWCKK